MIRCDRPDEKIFTLKATRPPDLAIFLSLFKCLHGRLTSWGQIPWPASVLIKQSIKLHITPLPNVQLSNIISIYLSLAHCTFLRYQVFLKLYRVFVFRFHFVSHSLQIQGLFDNLWIIMKLQFFLTFCLVHSWGIPHDL